MRHCLRNVLVYTVIVLFPLASTGAYSQPKSEPDRIKIGLLVPRSGVVAEIGTQMVQGWNLWWAQNGKKVAGKKIETYIENTGGDPSTGRLKAKRLVEQKGVNILVGPVLANVGLAIADYVEDREVLLAFPVVAADNVTQRARQWNVLRLAGWASSQVNHPLGKWAADHGYSTAVTIGNDYNFGHQNAGGFVRTFTDNEGRVIHQLWDPISTNDFSPYLTQIMSYNPDVVFAAQVGSDAVQFVKQWNNFGLKGRIPLLGNPTLLKQSLLRNMGKEALGLRSISRYSAARKSPANRRFVRLFDRKYGKLPAAEAASTFTAAKWLTESFRKLDHTSWTVRKLVKTIKTTEIDESPLGKIKMDQYGNPVIDVYLLKTVKRRDGRKWNKVIKTWEQVSQFWKYDPKQFLKQPVYSRDFQGLR